MSENAIPPVKRRLQWPWKWKWLRSLSLPMRILVIVATFLLLTFTVNVLSSVLGPLYSVVFLGEWSKPPVSESTRQILKRSLATDFSQIQVLERSITVTSSAEEMQIAFRLVIPTEDPIASRFAAGVDREHPALLTDVLFGTLQVDHSLLTYENFRPSQLEVDPKNTTLTLQAVFPDVNYPVEIVFTPNVEDKIQPEVDKLLIEMSDSMLIGMNPIPDRADQQNASLVKQAGEELPVFRIEIDRAGNFTRNESNQNNRLDRRSFLLKAGSFLNNIPLGSRLLFALSKSAPLLLFLWLATRPRPKDDDSEIDPNVRTLLALVTVLLVFHFSIQLGEGLGNWLGSVALFQSWERAAQAFSGQLSVALALLLRDGAARVQLVILGILAPAWFLLNRMEEPASPPGQWIRSRIVSRSLELIVFAFIVGAILWISVQVQTTVVCGDAFNQLLSGQNGSAPGDASALGPIYAFFTCGIPAWPWAILLLGILLLLMYWSLGALFYATTSEQRPLLAWAATAFLVLGELYRLYLAYHQKARGSQGEVWSVYAISLGAFLLWSFILYLFSVYRKLGLPWKPGAFAARWLFLGMLVLVIPFGFVFGSDPLEWDFLRLVFSLDDLLVLAGVAGLLLLLYQDGKSDLKLETATRLYGSLGLSALLFSTSARWLYIPITFLLGWAAIRWLLASGHDWGSIDEEFKKMSDTRSDLIKKGSLARLLDQAYLEYRSDRFDKLAKGDLKPGEFKTELDTWEADRNTASSLPESNLDKELAKHPLSFGPKPTAWENGLHGAKWASLFALPWFIIYLVNFMRGTSYSIPYPLLDFFIDILTIYGRWAAIGFVLGYFFPYLRGNSGLEKGLWLSLAVVVPTLPLYFIIDNRAAAWQAAAFWALQVLIECILLGLLAFDYSTVYQEPRGFNLLLELHGLRSLSLWTATLIAAIGTSAITLFSSQAVTLIGLTLKTLLPDVPIEFTPNP